MKYSIILSIMVFVILAVLAILTDATGVIFEANPYFFIIACLFFIISIVLWIIPWAFLLKKGGKLPWIPSIIMGFSCVYGALTPIQVGAEALRSIKAKELFGVSYSESISAAMVVKGLKFFILAIIASIVLVVVLLEAKLSGVMFFGLLSGFVVIVLAAALFLFPLNKRMGIGISNCFKQIGKTISVFKILEKYFFKYSNYLETIPRKKFLVVLFLAALSFAFEFFALLFTFFSLGVFIGLFPLAVLFILVSILERTPILPRGIGLVEAAGFIFLSLPEFSTVSLEIAQIGAILILFDVVRLLVPTIVSLFVSTIKIK